MKKEAISKAVRSIVAAMIGGAKGNRFIAAPSKQTVAQQTKEAPFLKSEKDGRLYAIAMLEAVAKECSVGDGFSAHSAEADGVDATDASAMVIFRREPQTDVFKRWLDHLYDNGTTAAVNGFFVVFTDALGQAAQEGSIDPAEHYSALELAGQIPPWGSVIYRDPKAAAAALASGECAYRIGGQMAPEPKAGRDESIEREALAILSGWEMYIFALDDMARRFGKSAYSLITVRVAVDAMVESLTEILLSSGAGKLDRAVQALPDGHKARGHLSEASAALNNLCIYLHDVDDSTGNIRRGKKESAEAVKERIGKAMFLFVLNAGQEIERAELACGGTATGGYLDGASDPNEV